MKEEKRLYNLMSYYNPKYLVLTSLFTHESVTFDCKREIEAVDSLSDEECESYMCFGDTLAVFVQNI